MPQLPQRRTRRRALLRGVRLRLHDWGDAPRGRRGGTCSAVGGRHIGDVGGGGPGAARRRGTVECAERARCPPSSVQNGSAEEAESFDWLAEVWIDPDWYHTQEVEDPCPSPGLPIIIPLRSRSVLMGRVSQSRNTHPEIDLSSDPGVSRRHAQLTTDGTRWFVEDLGSSNGTFVGAPRAAAG